MRLTLRLIVASLPLLLAVPASALPLRPWIAIDGSTARYSMGDPNAVFDQLNLELNGTAVTLWHIDSGLGFGASAGVDVGRSLALGLGCDRIHASSGGEGASASSLRPGVSGSLQGDPFFKFRAPANAMRALATYTLPHRGSLAAHVGIAGGIVSATGTVAEGLVPDVGLASLRGHGPLFEVDAGGDWLAQPRCALSLSLGYRSAKIDEVKVAGVIVHNADKSNFVLDYSGFFARLGAKFPLTRGADSSAASAFSGAKPWIGVDGSFFPYYAIGGVKRDLPNGEIEQKSTGLDFGATAGLDIAQRAALGLGYERVAGSSEWNGSIDLQHPADAFFGLAEYRFRLPGGLSARLGLKAGMLMEGGSTDIPGAGQPLKFTGSGPLVENYLAADLWRSSRLALTGALGYRTAKVTEVKANDAVLYTGNPIIENGRVIGVAYSRYSTDYSGGFVRLGLRAALTK